MNLLQKIHHATAVPDRVPPGWLTVQQWAALWGLKPARAGFLIRAAMAQKPPLVQTRTFRIMAGTRLYPVAHYAEKKP